MDHDISYPVFPEENEETQQSSHPPDSSNSEMMDSLNRNLDMNEDSKSPFPHKDCLRPKPKLRSKLSFLGLSSASPTNDLNTYSVEEEESSRPKPVPRQRNIKMNPKIKAKDENQSKEFTHMIELPELVSSLEDNALVSQQTSSSWDTRREISKPTEHSEQTLLSSDNSSNKCFSVEVSDISFRMTGTVIHYELIKCTTEDTGVQSDTFRESLKLATSTNLDASDSCFETNGVASNEQDKQISEQHIPKDGKTEERLIPLPTFLQNKSVSCMSSSDSDSESFHTPNSNDDTSIHLEYLKAKRQVECYNCNDVFLSEKECECRSMEHKREKLDSSEDIDIPPEGQLINKLLEPEKKQEMHDHNDYSASFKNNLASMFSKRNLHTYRDDENDDNDADANDNDADDDKENLSGNIQIGNKNIQLICQRMSQSATRNIQIGSRNVMINLRFQNLGSFKFEEKEENIFHLEQDKEVVYIKIKRFERKYTKTISESEYDKLIIPGRRKSRSTSKAIRIKKNPYMQFDSESMGLRSCSRIIEEIRFMTVKSMGHDDKHNTSEAETINRIVEEDGVLYECIDKEVAVQIVTPPNNTMKHINNACMNGDIDSIFETLCSVENISCFIQKGGHNFDVELIGNEEDEDIYHETEGIDDCSNNDYDMPADWTLTTHIHQKLDEIQNMLDTTLKNHNQDSLYSTVEKLGTKVWYKESDHVVGGNISLGSSSNTRDMVKILSEDPDYDCPDCLSTGSDETCVTNFRDVPVTKVTKSGLDGILSTSNSSTSSGSSYNESSQSTKSLGAVDRRPMITAKNSFLIANALPRGYLTLTEEYNFDEKQGSYCRSLSPSLKYQTPIPPPRPPEIKDGVILEESRGFQLLQLRSSPFGRGLSSEATSPPLPQRQLPSNLRAMSDRPMQPLPPRAPVKPLHVEDCAIERTKSSSELNNSTKPVSEKLVGDNTFGDMSRPTRRFLSEGQKGRLTESDDNIPPVPPRHRSGKVLNEKEQNPGPSQKSEIPKISSPVVPTRGLARKDAQLGQYGLHPGNVMSSSPPVNKKYADGSKSTSQTLPSSANDNDSSPPASLPNRNPKYLENKFETTTKMPDNLFDCGNVYKRSENIYTEDPFQPLCYMQKEAARERSSSSSYVIPNLTNHSTERTRMIRNKPMEATCGDRSVQEIASSRLWYHGNLDRCVAKQMLVNLSINGIFLVRDASSPNQPNHVYTLETYYVGSVYKFQILKEKGEFYFSGFPNRAFRTLDAMVECMMTNGMEVQDNSEEWIHIILTLPWRVCMEKKAEK